MQELNLDLLEQLDRHWTEHRRSNALDLLTRVPSGNWRLAAELCAADLEWRYRSDERQTNDPDKAPAAEDYQGCLEQYWDVLECRQNIMESEWSARNLWGDPPEIDAFASRLPILSNWSTRLASQLDELVPLFAVMRNANLQHSRSARVNHQFAIGRQDSGDPQAPAWVEGKNRLVVANAHFRIISRDQLQVRRTSVKEVELRNTSSAAEVRIDDLALAPQQIVRRPLPCTMMLGQVTLTLRTT